MTTVLNKADIIYAGKTLLTNEVSTLIELMPTAVKAVDKLTARVGDILTYTITITNPNVSAITNVVFEDPYDTTHLEYVAGSFTVNGTAKTPTSTSPSVTYTIASIPSLGTAVVVFKAKVI